MANQSYSLLKKLFITVFAYSFVLSSCSSSKRCNFDELNKKGNQTFDDIEICNVGLLRTCTIENIYQLGDSISDAGNSILEGPAGASSPFARLPYGTNFPTGPTGRASNGYLIVDYLALDAGLPLLPPFKKGDADFGHGVNFAVAGATALPPDGLAALNISSPLANASLSEQLDWMDTHFNSLPDNQRIENTKNALFILGPFGGSDYEYALFQGKSVQEIESTLIPKVVNAIMRAVERLLQLGAREMVVPGLYTISGLPIYRTAFPKETSEAKDDLAVRHNAQLQQAINKFKQEQMPYALINYLDYFSAYQTLQSYAASGGHRMDEKVCCGSGGGDYNFNSTGRCGAEGVRACSDPEKHISWDGINLTQEAYRIMSKYILYALSYALGCPSH